MQVLKKGLLTLTQELLKVSGKVIAIEIDKNMIQVLNDNQKIIASLTESQVLDALLNHSIRIKLGEIKEKML